MLTNEDVGELTLKVEVGNLGSDKATSTVQIRIEGSGDKYFTLEQMKNLGWSKIYSGYTVVSTGRDSPLDDMSSEIRRNHSDINQEDFYKINALFEKYQINTKKRICAFFAECSAETTNGDRFLEGLEQKKFRSFVLQTDQTLINGLMIIKIWL